MRNNYYASPSSGDAYSDRLLILSFELKFFVCRHRHFSLWGFRIHVCLSVRLSIRTPRKEITLASPISVLCSSNWYINGKVFTSTTAWKPKNLFSFQKRSNLNFNLYFDLCWNLHSFVNISPTVLNDSYMNGKVFISTTAWEPKNLILLKKTCLTESFCCYDLFSAYAIFSLYCAHR